MNPKENEIVPSAPSLERAESGKVWMVEERRDSTGPSTALWELDGDSWKEVTDILELLALGKNDVITSS